MPSTASPSGATATAGTGIGVPVSVPTPTTNATMSSGGIGATTITNMVRPAGIDFDAWSGARASRLGLQAATRIGPDHSTAGRRLRRPARQSLKRYRTGILQHRFVQNVLLGSRITATLIGTL